MPARAPSGRRRSHAGDRGGGRVLVVGRDALFRFGVVLAFEAAGLEVVGEASAAEAGPGLVDALRPDLTLLALDPGEDVEIVGRLRRAEPEARVFVLVGSESERCLLGAVAAGACGYLPMTTPPEHIAAAVATAIGAEALVLPSAAAELLARTIPGVEIDELSERELEVLRLVVGGRDNAEIAAELFISESTAKFHVSRILRKLHTRNRIQAAVYAVRQQLV